MRMVSRAASLAAILAAPAAAQLVPDNFSLERAPSPVVAPTPTPVPTPTSTPVTAPSGAPTASPPAATATTAADRDTTPQPQASASSAAPPPPGREPDPIATATARSSPRAVADPVPVAVESSPVPPLTAPAAADPDGAAERWPWLLGGVAIAFALAGAVLWARRRDRDGTPRHDPVPITVPEPAPVALKPAGGLITTALRPALEFALRPNRADIDTLRASLEYTLIVRNTGRAPARAVAIEAWLFSAGTDPAGVYDELIASPPGTPLLDAFDLPASGTIDVGAEGKMARDGLAVLTAGERKLFVPMVAVRARYRDGRGTEQVARAAFMVGVPRPGQERLAPLALDRGARGWTALEARPYERGGKAG